MAHGAHPGPRLSVISVLSGVEVVHNKYRMENIPALTGTYADPAWMLGVPILLALDLKVFSAWGGVTPMFITGGTRAKVDWSAHRDSGFGDEMHVDLGFRFKFGKFGLGAAMRARLMQPFNTTSLTLGGKVGF